MSRFLPCLLVAAILAAGCSGDAPTTSTWGSAPLAILSEHAVLETIRVPTDGTAVVSATVLEAGMTYTIRASGTFPIGGPGDGLADAEYSDFSDAPASLLDHCGGVETGVDLGIGIDDATVDSDKMPHWGDYEPTHVYTVEWVGAGAAVTLNYHDCGYGDNSDSLTVEILELEAEVEFMVDIKPGSEENPIHPGSRGVIPVAILGSDVFDVATIDETSLVFGPGEAGIAHKHVHYEDVNGDEIMDLVAHFRTQDVGVSAGDTELCLTAMTTDETELEGCWSIVTVPRDKDEG